jgi:hypothetical protein
MPLVDRVEQRLTSSAIWLTYGGMVTFINSALSPLIIYALCVLKIPLQILEFIDRARRHCLWKKSEDREEKTYSLAAWDIVCQPKDKGGLGLMDLKVQNQGLLLKYMHKFFNKQDIPWVILVWDNYYQNGAPLQRDLADHTGGEMSVVYFLSTEALLSARQMLEIRSYYGKTPGQIESLKKPNRIFSHLLSMKIVPLCNSWKWKSLATISSTLCLLKLILNLKSYKMFYSTGGMTAVDLCMGSEGL